MQSWEAQGLRIAVMTLLVNDQFGGAPTVSGAELWKSNFGLVSVHVAADPFYAMVPASVSSFGTPQQTVIDPRTMQVILRQEGWAGMAPPQLISLALSNQP